jgi:integrase/recombinase XerD
VRRRFVPHQLRHAHAVEMAREGVPLTVIQRRLGHGNLGVTSVSLQGIDSGEIIETVHARRAPVIYACSSQRASALQPVSVSSPSAVIQSDTRSSRSSPSGSLGPGPS